MLADLHRMDAYERALRKLVRPGDVVLDLGCGTGILAMLAARRGARVHAVESMPVVHLAQQLVAHNRLDVHVHHADICEWEFPRKYDFISAWDSIWHLPLAQQEPVLKKILHGLTSDGICIFTTGGLDSPSEKVDSAMGPQMYYSVLRIPNLLKLISEAGCICRHLEYDQYPELHLYVIAQRT